MDRVRLATVLAVVAVLAVVSTAAVAVTTYAGQDDDNAPSGKASAVPLTVRDPASGATFEVPGSADWRVRGRGLRIYYADPQGQPAAVVRGPAVFRPGYCEARPDGSNRGFVGFTRQGFGTWAHALARSLGTDGHWSTGVARSQVELADGSTARMTTSDLFQGGRGACAAPGVAVSMVRTGDVRLVLVRDTTTAGTLSDDEAEAVLTSLRLPH